MRDETQPFVVGAGLTIVGDIDAAGGLRVEGSVRGRVFVRGTLTVASGAVVEGFVQALEIDVFGRLSGVIRAEAEVRLQAEGIVTGDVEAPRVRFVKGDRVSVPPPDAPAPGVPAARPAPPPAPPPEPEAEDRALPPARSGHAPGALPPWPPQGLPKTPPVWAPRSARPASAPQAPPGPQPPEEPEAGPPAPPSITGGQRQIVVRRK